MRIHQSDLDKVLKHCLDEVPYEACGVLAGAYGAGVILEVYPMRNEAPDPTVTYRFNPVRQLSLYDRLDGVGWAPLGIYHSHPYGLPELSPTDLAMLPWPAPIQLVVAVERAIAAAASGSGDLASYLRAWRPVAFHRAVEEPIEVVPTQHLTPDVAG